MVELTKSRRRKFIKREEVLVDQLTFQCNKLVSLSLSLFLHLVNSTRSEDTDCEVYNKRDRRVNRSGSKPKVMKHRNTASFGRCSRARNRSESRLERLDERRTSLPLITNLIQDGSRSEACSPRGARDPLEPQFDLSGFISHVGLGMPRHTARHKDARARVREGAYLRGPPRRAHPPIRELCKPIRALRSFVDC